jgi:hypothetical protein
MKTYITKFRPAAQGWAAHGRTINAGNWVDDYGILCARPVLTP